MQPLHSTFLPDLQILETDNLVLHEDVDPRRIERLVERLREERILKHPPVVAPIPNEERYVVLDGANRTSAFLQMKIPHILAQVVRYGSPHVVLDTWYHVVSGMPLEAFEAALQAATDLQLLPCSLEDARLALTTGEAAAYIICEQGVRMVCNHEREQGMRNIQLLRDIVATYRGKADIFRASNDIWEKQVPYYPQITALVVFPTLLPADIMQAARGGVKLPSGITRHIISNRALNVNIPLDVFEAPWSLTRKQQWLKNWLMERMAANAIRYYSESTFTFDE